MCAWSTSIGKCVLRLPSARRRSSANRQAGKRRSLTFEALEDRCLPSGYSITDIGPILAATSYMAPSGPQSGINNASAVQVVGENAAGHAYLWDSGIGMQDLGTLNGDQSSHAYGINNSSQVVGISGSSKEVIKKGRIYFVQNEEAFLWSSSTGLKNIGSWTFPSGINSSGELSGTVTNEGSAPEASLRGGRNWIQLGNLSGGTYSFAYGINDVGQVVGYGDIPNTPTSSGLYHAFLWTPSSPNSTSGTMIDLGTLFSTTGGSWASAINRQGWVTGRSDDANASGAGHAYLWRPSSANGTTGTMIDLGTLAVNPDPGLSQSEGNAINSGGVVVGDANPAGATSQNQVLAVVWQPGANGSYTLSDLNTLIPSGSGWTLTRADAINDSGQIVVEATNGTSFHALLLTPSATAAALSLRLPATATPTPASPGPGSLRATPLANIVASLLAPSTPAPPAGASNGQNMPAPATAGDGLSTVSASTQSSKEVAPGATPARPADVIDALFAQLDAGLSVGI